MNGHGLVMEYRRSWKTHGKVLTADHENIHGKLIVIKMS